jgi:hypothetical protein
MSFRTNQLLWRLKAGSILYQLRLKFRTFTWRLKTPKKRAFIIKTNTNYWIHSQSKTTTGIGIASPPFIKMTLDVVPEQLVNNLFIALEKSGNIVPYPKDWKAFKNEFNKNLEIKTAKSFYMGAKCCGVSDVDNSIVLMPMERVDNRGTFYHLPESELNVSRSESAEKIFEAIQETFDRSK